MNFDEYDDVEKNCMFQYATIRQIIKDTTRITRKEAEMLFAEYLPDIKRRWNLDESPEMVIWIDCYSETSYHTKAKHINYEWCTLENGHFYEVKKELIA